jgi:hypothetical protein
MLYKSDSNATPSTGIHGAARLGTPSYARFPAPDYGAPADSTDQNALIV